MNGFFCVYLKMSNTTSRIAPKKTYIISNELMLKMIDKLPTLIQNNKNTEFILQVKTKNDEIIDESAQQNNKLTSDTSGTLKIQFSYDFVNDRWFLNDHKIKVTNRDRS